MLDITDYEAEEGVVTIYAEPTEYGKIADVLKDNNLESKEEAIMFIPMQTMEIKDPEEQAKFDRLIEGLNELDDVKDVFHNVISSGE